MSFFRKIAHFASQPFHSLESHIPGGKYIVPAALSLINPGVAAAYTASNAYGHGASIGDSLKRGGLQYAGSQIGGAIGRNLGGSYGTIGESLAKNTGINLGQSVPGDTIGNFIGENAPQAGQIVGSANIGSTIGSSIGGKMGSDYAAATSTASNASSPSGPAPYVPTQEAAQKLPDSINSLGSLTADQQSSNLANQGVYGSGNGPQEQQYFENLINRRLVDQSGKTQSLSTLKPIEQSYLQKLGLGGYTNTSNLLEGLNKWKKQQATA